ncbi:hypothetical protein NLI96_g6252 [Meripilus lineatus]|uniref:Uncharacterized protein n=1 Tax=Meripilus lineatus TaxID=2056292 RepID=A0AAD5V1F6_9APHY|nr:hypothetical protein NLI96_g6252 [Physisporinus lineatus]
MPDNLIFYIFYTVAPKLFLNSFLAMMNARHFVPNPDDTNSFAFPPSSSSALDFGSRNAQIIDVRIETTTERRVEDQSSRIFSTHAQPDIKLSGVRL